jgi:hypothetical protein
MRWMAEAQERQAGAVPAVSCMETAARRDLILASVSACPRRYLEILRQRRKTYRQGSTMALAFDCHVFRALAKGRCRPACATCRLLSVRCPETRDEGPDDLYIISVRSLSGLCSRIKTLTCVLLALDKGMFVRSAGNDYKSASLLNTVASVGRTCRDPPGVASTCSLSPCGLDRLHMTPSVRAGYGFPRSYSALVRVMASVEDMIVESGRSEMDGKCRCYRSGGFGNPSSGSQTIS